jgi:hypothetical protein
MEDPHAFVNTVQQQFAFLVQQYGFTATVTRAQGTYHSEVVLISEHLQVTVGIWGQGNELWVILAPPGQPPLHLPAVLNGLTGDREYFQEHMERKITSTVYAGVHPEYLHLCALALKQHGGDILAGDLARWADLVRAAGG